MKAINESQETELWPFVNAGDGKNCPGFDSCQSQRNTPICFNSEAEREKNRCIHLFIDKDEIDPVIARNYPQLSQCEYRSRITSLVRILASKYRKEKWNGILPVPDNLISACPNGLPIEVRCVSLKANHGALWRMDDGWLIYLNSESSPARQRFTLYHEIFHILAHSSGDTFFKHSDDDEVYFNEYLADHFSGALLTPRDIVKERWPEIKNVTRMAKLFDVPAPIMYGKLRALGFDLSSI
jgi:hypothetical protein